MTVETKMSLTDETITALQELISVNLDSEKGFREASEHCDDNSAVRDMFEELARERAANAAELKQFVCVNGEEPEDSGSIAGACHRFLLDIRGKLGGGSPVILIEAERGEDYIKGKYEDLLKENAGSAVTDVLNRQYASVKEGHDRVRDMRDRANA